MYLLSKIATDKQVEEFRCLSSTGGSALSVRDDRTRWAGSDPNQLATEAVYDGTDYVINGRKWLITGANGARTWIIMARVAPNEHGADGPTLFRVTAIRRASNSSG